MATKDDPKAPQKKLPPTIVDPYPSTEEADEADEEGEDEDEDEEEEGDADEEGADDDGDTDEEGADEEEDDDEEDSDEEDSDEEDDEEAEAHSERPLHRPPPVAVGHQVTPTDDPTWWLPYAVLGALVLIGVIGFFGLFNGPLEKMGILKPQPSSSSSAAHAVASASATGHAQPEQPAPSNARPTQPPQPPPVETFAAKQILVRYKGGLATPASVERTKEEAKARAEKLLALIKGGKSFEEVVTGKSDEKVTVTDSDKALTEDQKKKLIPNSDEEGAAERKGDQGRFRANVMPAPYMQALTKLKVGETSGVVETQLGYHIIVRTM